VSELTKILQAASQYTTPALIIFDSLVVGYLVERFILGYAKKIALKTDWKTDDILLKGITGMPTIWFVIGGIYWAFANSTILEKDTIHITNKLLGILAIITATIVIARIIVEFIHTSAGKSGNKTNETSIIVNLVNISIFIIGGLVALQTLGISITPILTALGVGGLAVALALQDTLSNLFSGLQIILTQQIRIGDYIKLSTEEEGYVTDITWRNTTIRKLANNLVIVPNGKIASSIMTNYSRPQEEMSVLINVGVDYRSDLQKVEQVTIEVAEQVMQEQAASIGTIQNFKPFMRYHTFGDFSISFNVILKVTEFVNQYLLKHEFIKALHKRYKQEGIIIPFPIRTLEGEISIKENKILQ